MVKNNLAIERRIKIIKPFFVLLLISSLFLLLFLLSCSNENKGENISFNTIAKDFYSQQVQKENYIVKDAKGLNQLFELIDNENFTVKVDDIDFSKEMLVAVFMGEKPTGGYNIEIINILKKKDHLEFLIKIDEPGPDDMVIQSITSPYHIVKLERFDTECLFNIVD
jgi:hypothetical protein